MSKTNFDDWMMEVDACLIDYCAMDSSDLPDVDYYSNWESNVTPQEMADAVIMDLEGGFL